VSRRNKKFETFSDLFKQKKPTVVASPAGFSIFGDPFGSPVPQRPQP